MANSAKPLLIVESPTKANTIKRLLGGQYEVAASQGHVRDLPEKGKGLLIEKIGQEYRFQPLYELLPRKKPTIQALQEKVQQASQVWLATDEDREGEAIAWHLCELLGIDPQQPVRIAFHEITQKALQDALAAPRRISLSLVHAQQARRVLDRLVGYEISPLLWRTFPQGKGKTALSAGRVQSVALRLIVERERAIAQFRPTATLVAEVLLDSTPAFQATLIAPPLPDLATAQTYLKALVGQALRVSQVEKKTRRRSPPPPFITSTLQQEAQRSLGFSLQRTMRAAQNLYEKGLITYMRTDSPHLAPEALTAIHKALQERFGEKAVRPRTWESRSTHAQEAHEAIRPTDPTVAEAGDTADEQKLYHLIWRRTLATQMPDAVYEETLAQLEPEHATEPPLQFEARGRTLLQAGFLELYGYAEEEETPTLPPLQEGQLWKWKSVRLWEKFNTPPARYTEGTLVRELEARGIGRPSTYAPTVETLFKRGYIRRENIRLVKPPFKEVFLYPDGTLEEQRQTPPAEVQKNKLVPTELGAQVVDFLVGRFPDIMNYDFTAQVEEELDQIAAEKLDWQEMLNAFYAHFTAELEQAQNSRQAFQHRVLGYDPVSQKPIYLHIGRKGPFVALGEKGDPDHRTASVPSALALDTLSLEAALELLSFPRPIGEYEGHPITIHSGPYGYYLKHQGQNYSLLPGMSPFSLTVEEAIEAIEAKRAKAQGAEVLLSFPEAGITIVKGRYGPYIRHPAGTCSIPKSTPVSKLTLDDCQKLIAQKQKQLSSRRSKTSPKASSSRTKR